MAAGSRPWRPSCAREDGRHIVIRPLAYIAERDIARYARGMRFPLIPCTLCGSQPNLQRHAIKAMLAGWEREHPGRVQSIFSALRHVEPGTLADPRLFDFAGLTVLAGGTAGGPGGRRVHDRHRGAGVRDRGTSGRAAWRRSRLASLSRFAEDTDPIGAVRDAGRRMSLQQPWPARPLAADSAHARLVTSLARWAPRQ